MYYEYLYVIAYIGRFTLTKSLQKELQEVMVFT